MPAPTATPPTWQAFTQLPRAGLRGAPLQGRGGQEWDQSADGDNGRGGALGLREATGAPSGSGQWGRTARAGGAEASRGLGLHTRQPSLSSQARLSGVLPPGHLCSSEGQVRQESCPELPGEGAVVPTQQSSLMGRQVALAPSIYPSGPEKAGRSPEQRVIF